MKIVKNEVFEVELQKLAIEMINSGEKTMGVPNTSTRIVSDSKPEKIIMEITIPKELEGKVEKLYLVPGFEKSGDE